MSGEGPLHSMQWCTSAGTLKIITAGKERAQMAGIMSIVCLILGKLSVMSWEKTGN